MFSSKNKKSGLKELRKKIQLNLKLSSTEKFVFYILTTPVMDHVPVVNYLNVKIKVF